MLFKGNPHIPEYLVAPQNPKSEERLLMPVDDVVGRRALPFASVVVDRYGRYANEKNRCEQSIRKDVNSRTKKPWGSRFLIARTTNKERQERDGVEFNETRPFYLAVGVDDGSGNNLLGLFFDDKLSWINDNNYYY